MSEALLERLAHGGYLWPWVWRRLRQRDDPACLDALLAGLLALPGDTTARREPILACLRVTAERAFGLLQLRQTERATALCRALAAEPPSIASLVESAPLPNPLLADYAAVLEAVGDAARDGLRELLDGPPLPVETFEPKTDPRTPWRFAGAKLTALAALGPHCLPDDRPRLLRLADDEAEPVPVRYAASALAALLSPEFTPRQALAQALFDLPQGQLGRGSAKSYDYWTRQLAVTGVALVEPALDCLDGGGPTLRRRAADLLVAIGQPARTAVTARLASTRDFQTRNALRRVLRAVTTPETPQRAAGDRSLTRAARPGADAERGLSRAEEPP